MHQGNDGSHGERDQSWILQCFPVSYGISWSVKNLITHTPMTHAWLACSLKPDPDAGNALLPLLATDEPQSILCFNS
jgi:hypothetical protein